MQVVLDQQEKIITLPNKVPVQLGSADRDQQALLD